MVFSLCVHLGDGLVSGLLIDDRAAVRVGGDEGLTSKVVHRPGKAPTGFMDAREGVVGKERVGPAAEREVMAHVARRLRRSSVELTLCRARGYAEPAGHGGCAYVTRLPIIVRTTTTYRRWF